VLERCIRESRTIRWFAITNCNFAITVTANISIPIPSCTFLFRMARRSPCWRDLDRTLRIHRFAFLKRMRKHFAL